MHFRYLPHTSADLEKMCETVGVGSINELFQSIPEHLRLRQNLDLPSPLSEIELLGHLQSLSEKNRTVEQYTSFLGAGAYKHTVPAAVGALVSRGEFKTSYTPYQPELAQGTLQAIFEFQTMIASLLGMEIANASNYDGSTALAEAVLMALRINKRKKILLSKSIHPEYRQVVRTTLHSLGFEIEEIGWDEAGTVDLQQLDNQLSQEVSAVCLQSPNFFGIVEDQAFIAERAHSQGALFIAVNTDPVALGMLAPPGSLGADIAVGEGNSFGGSLNLGGPYVGLFATKKQFVRQIPGRLVGETVDSEGKRGFVLTLNTREQHIRREKATSNICTNQSLCALAAAIHLALLGPEGLSKLALLNFSKAEFAKKLLLQIPGVTLLFQGNTFHEFALRVPGNVEKVLKKLLEKRIFGGLALGRLYPELEEGLLVCVTETHSKEKIERFALELEKILQG